MMFWGNGRRITYIIGGLFILTIGILFVTGNDTLLKDLPKGAVSVIANTDDT
jgi:hypothetical protein